MNRSPSFPFPSAGIMLRWATEQIDKLSQTVAPPPTDPAGRFAHSVQRQEEEAAMGCIAEMDPSMTVVVPARGAYPIHLACQYSMVRLIRLLMSQPGVSIEQTDGAGNTPLHYACMGTSRAATLDLVKMLLTEYRADVCAKNFQGQTPYDLATLDSVRQYLLPIQLQKETQFALDNGGQGLPPGIDLGGLRIKNSAMPPPPTFGSGDATGAAAMMTPHDAGTAPTRSRYAAIPMPNFAPSPHTPVTQPPVGQAAPGQAYLYHHGAAAVAPSPVVQQHQVAPAPASMPTPARGPSTRVASATPSTDSSESGYSRVGGSSAAIFSKYRADGFHSSSSDVSLQRKYGHVGTAGGAGGAAAVVPPPPSSGSSSVGLAPVSGGSNAVIPGLRPFSRSASAGSGGYRPPGAGYAAYGIGAAPASGPAYPPMGGMNSPATAAAMPGGTAPPAYFVPQPAPSDVSASDTAAAGTTVAAPTTPYMPPPPYQTTSYAATAPTIPTPSVGAAAAAAFASPAVAVDPSVVSTPSAARPSVVGVGGAASPFGTPLPGRGAVVEATSLFESPPPAANDDGKPDGTAAAVPSDPEPPSTSGLAEAEATTPASATGDEDAAAAGPNGGWEEVADPSSGRVYYYNASTGETSWDRPAGGVAASSTTSPQQETTGSGEWLEVTDPTSGRVYYYNPTTNETSWEKPESIQQQQGDGGEVASTGDSTAPSALGTATAGQAAELPTATSQGNDWVEATDPSSGQPYYYNTRTQETSWDRPVELVPSDAEKEHPEEMDPPSTSTAPGDMDDTAIQQEAAESSPVKEEMLSGNRPEDTSTAEATNTIVTDNATTTESAGEETEEIQPTVAEGESEDAVTGPPEEANVTQPSSEIIIEATDEDPPLPDGWSEATAPDSGLTYFYHSGTGEVSWERPTAPVASTSSKEGDLQPAENGERSTAAADETTAGVEADVATSNDGADDWVETTDATTGQSYYFNAKTGVTSWEKPSSVGEVQQQAPASEQSGDWAEAVEPSSGQIYYYNSKTGETSWEKPAVLMGSAEMVHDTSTDPTTGDVGEIGLSPAVEVALELPVPSFSAGALHNFERTRSAEELFDDGPPGDAAPKATNGITQPLIDRIDVLPTAAATLGPPTTHGDVGSPGDLPVGSPSAETIFGSAPIAAGAATAQASTAAFTTGEGPAGYGSAEARAERAPEEIATADPVETTTGSDVKESLTVNSEADILDTGDDGEMMDIPLSPDPVRLESTKDDSGAIGVPVLPQTQSRPVASDVLSTEKSPRGIFDAPLATAPAAAPAEASDLFAAIGLPPPPFQRKR